MTKRPAVIPSRQRIGKQLLENILPKIAKTVPARFIMAKIQNRKQIPKAAVIRKLH